MTRVAQPRHLQFPRQAGDHERVRTDLIAATLMAWLNRLAQNAMVEAILRVLRYCLAMLVGFAIVGGTTIQFARSAEYGMVVAGMPCDQMMPAQVADGHAKTMTPCKKMTGDCPMQLCGVADIALPAKTASLDMMVRHHLPLVYWANGQNLAALVREP